MAGKGKLVTQTVKLGIKYGPQIWVATQALREPAKQAANKAISSERARRQAMAHATSLADGSILKVYQGDASLWVVFSGDEPVGVHPETDLPLTALVERADLTKRIRPQDKVKATDRAKDAATAALRRGKPNQIN
ncbi:hypothetical protein [Terrabacter sp. MAHUQ-38]|uniref:hypothetical protein n=1 Tax=unclassified Terrabacter TaxID=2630222 RepID=UPI00165DB12A|nr:hypothetical protein [Terrabacter sp. MAHUQ-38]MBC9822201.1 hypothetical protein [Terrabacter sp. MAHUQ-38]